MFTNKICHIFCFTSAPCSDIIRFSRLLLRCKCKQIFSEAKIIMSCCCKNYAAKILMLCAKSQRRVEKF